MGAQTAKELLAGMKDPTQYRANILATRVEAVLALHKSDHLGGVGFCAHCNVGYPCPTVRILDGGE